MNPERRTRNAELNVSFTDFKDGAGFTVAVARAKYDGGRNWYGGYDNLKGNSPELNGAEFFNVQDSIGRAAVGLRSWPDELRPALTTWLQYAMLQIGGTSGTPEQMLDQLVRYMNANGHYVDGLPVGYGDDPADNVIGVHRRITVNKYGHRIETGNHDIPDGIKIRVIDSEATGRSNAIRAQYSAGNSSGDRVNSLKTGGFSRRTAINLRGPRTTGLARNAVLQGNETTTDGADITDGTATTGGISGWDQTRTGSPTVKARPNDAFGEQPYGIGIGNASATFKIEQSYERWNLERARPVAVMFPVKLDGAAWEGDITWALGGVSDTYDETDLTNGSYEYLTTALDEDGYPEGFDDGDDLFSLTFAMDAFTDGGEEVILGGVYAMLGVQLQPGGEFHFAWENGSEPTIGTTTNFGADTQGDDGEIQHGFTRAFPAGPSLPVSGSTLWTADAGPALQGSSPNNGTVSAAYNETITATGGLTPYVFSVVDGSLPTGLSMDSEGNITGTPTTANDYEFVVQVRDALGRTDIDLMRITVDP